ncbi:MAG: hypothetical protein JO288_18395, partial [Hyphomicrobiales bacterium]|nr:hypothetical protein [Hyphomicrobiales bacterium]
ILAYGALILTHIIRRAPEILTIGVAFLGWIAGGMAVSDPLLSGWIGANAPALATFAPALAAAFVLIAGLDVPLRQARGVHPSAPATWPSRSRQGRIPSPAFQDAGPPSRSPASFAEEDRPPGFALEAGAASSDRGWSEERIVVAGFVLLAFLAGLIIFFASFLDSLT